MAALFPNKSALVAIAAIGATNRTAVAKPLGDHQVSGQLGIPIALVLNGLRSSDSEGGYGAAGQLEYAYRITPSVFVGAWTGASLLFAGNKLGSHVEIFTGGPAAFWQPVLDFHKLRLTAGLGLGGMLADVTIDEYIRKRTISVGTRLALRVSLRFAEQWTIGTGLTLEFYGAPIGETTWFNQPLGPTSHLTGGLSVSWESL